MNLKVGDSAPQFSLTDQDNKLRSLKEFQDHWVLLYFYPEDDTPGCTTEACEFRDAFTQLEHSITILGVSQDSVASHQKFAAKYGLPFTLLADEHKTAINAYGANGLLFNKRVSFVIDPNGKIAKIYDKVDVHKHAAQVLADIKQLQAA